MFGKLMVGVVVLAVASAQAAPPKVDEVPEELLGFKGRLIGKIVLVNTKDGTLVLEVRQMKRAFKVSKAKDPESAVGKTFLIKGITGAPLNALKTMRVGSGIEFEIMEDGKELKPYGNIMPADLPPAKK